MANHTQSAQILVVDDDAILTELLPVLLGSLGHTVDVACSGAAALRLLAPGHSVDIILTDLRMPGLSGLALARELATLRGPCALLLGMSGSHPTETELQLFDAFLPKPFGLEEFSQAVEQARRKRRAMPAQRGTAHQVTASSASSGSPAVLDPGTFARLSQAMSAEQLRHLYACTLADLQTRTGRLRSAARNRDRDTVRRESHAIRGGCAMVGATELAAFATLAAAAAPLGLPMPDFSQAAARLQRALLLAGLDLDAVPQPHPPQQRRRSYAYASGN